MAGTVTIHLRNMDLEQVKELTRAEWQHICTLERKTAVAYWCLGKCLLILKQQLPRGTWMEFLEELGISQSRANRAMLLAGAYHRPEVLVRMTLYEALGYERVTSTTAGPIEPDGTGPKHVPRETTGPIAGTGPDTAPEPARATATGPIDPTEHNHGPQVVPQPFARVVAEIEETNDEDYIVGGDFHSSLPSDAGTQAHDDGGTIPEVVCSVIRQKRRWLAVIELGNFQSQEEAMVAVEKWWLNIMPLKLG